MLYAKQENWKIMWMNQFPDAWNNNNDKKPLERFAALKDFRCFESTWYDFFSTALIRIKICFEFKPSKMSSSLGWYSMFLKLFVTLHILQSWSFQIDRKSIVSVFKPSCFFAILWTQFRETIEALYLWHPEPKSQRTCTVFFP